MAFKSFGIVGYGNFGRFLATSLVADGRRVVAYDADAAKVPLDGDVESGSIEEVLASDVVFLAVPFPSLAAVLEQVTGRVPPGTVVADVVSTKARATELLVEALGTEADLVSTHPLFGPPSMDRITPGDRIVITHEQGPRAAEFIDFLGTDLGLVVERVTSNDHDHAMAYMQSLPFFIARALVELDILDLQHKEELAIPSFEKLLTIANIETHHTDAMFATSQLSNPFAGAARRQFIEALIRIENELSGRDVAAPWSTDGHGADGDVVASIEPFDIDVQGP